MEGAVAGVRDRVRRRDPESAMPTNPAATDFLKRIAEDRTSKEIADEFGISYRTVENHRSNICERLNLHGSHSLLKFAFDNKSRL